ncbi:hypothetical protein BJF79_36530 [Actinomadura sp. CNU-125]|uniref:hypothetical protein n=1 Tax=Actinomadura sp. CNU-125 TaxID=1904961 RepID=UPI000966E904|nr:hypothetical protein [Actinomadura sp. CNU-125]OLT32008.1 hypothetical protein BJF79_36530 [Actinomadura sp. CNU-125]
MVGRAELLAQGSFENVRAAGEGAATVCASRVGNDGSVGLAWDLARGVRVGDPLPGFPCDDEEWAFGVLPGPRGASPVVAWADGGRVHVHDLYGGDEVVIDDAEASFPDVVGLAVHRGRGAVVTVFDRRPHADVLVWDARTGERLARFDTWFGYLSPDRHLLHATPDSGPLVALSCESERGKAPSYSMLDVEIEGQVGKLDRGAPPTPMVPWADGVVLVHGEGGRIVVRRPDGEAVAEGPAPEDAPVVAAARAGGRLLVAAGDRRAGAFTARDDARPEPLGRVEVPGPVGGVALASDGTLVAATDTGLFRARVTGSGSGS